MTRNNGTGQFCLVTGMSRVLKLPTSNNWRASLVPAAAVIPAPVAYTNVAAVKKLVVGFLVDSYGPALRG